MCPSFGGERQVNHISRRLVSAIALLTVILFAAPALAQTGRLRGKVTDAEGQPIEGAVVKSRARARRARQKSRRTRRANYMQIGLFPGDYKVTVGKGGAAFSLDTRVALGDPTMMDISLKPQAGGANAAQAERDAKLRGLFEAGVTAVQAGDYDDAIAKFTETTTMLPTCHVCYYNIGAAYREEGTGSAGRCGERTVGEDGRELQEVGRTEARLHGWLGRTRGALQPGEETGIWLHRRVKKPTGRAVRPVLRAAAARERSTTRASSSGTGPSATEAKDKFEAAGEPTRSTARRVAGAAWPGRTSVTCPRRSPRSRDISERSERPARRGGQADNRRAEAEVGPLRSRRSPTSNSQFPTRSRFYRRPPLGVRYWELGTGVDIGSWMLGGSWDLGVGTLNGVPAPSLRTSGCAH